MEGKEIATVCKRKKKSPFILAPIENCGNPLSLNNYGVSNRGCFDVQTVEFNDEPHPQKG